MTSRRLKGLEVMEIGFSRISGNISDSIATSKNHHRFVSLMTLGVSEVSKTITNLEGLSHTPPPNVWTWTGPTVWNARGPVPGVWCWRRSNGLEWSEAKRGAHGWCHGSSQAAILWGGDESSSPIIRRPIKGLQRPTFSKS